MPTLNERLVQLRKERGVLQKVIAADNNLSLRAYRYYETGERKPDSDTLQSLADYFNVSLDYLVGRSDDPARR